jgi:hypothetical protein
MALAYKSLHCPSFPSNGQEGNEVAHLGNGGVTSACAMLRRGDQKTDTAYVLDVQNGHKFGCLSSVL